MTAEEAKKALLILREEDARMWSQLFAACDDFARFASLGMVTQAIATLTIASDLEYNLTGDCDVTCKMGEHYGYHFTTDRFEKV